MPDRVPCHLLDSVCLPSAPNCAQYTVNFLNLLIDQNRIEALDEICESFEKSYCALTDTQVRHRQLGGCGCWAEGREP